MSQRDIAEQIKALYDVEVSPELVSKLSGRLNPLFLSAHPIWISVILTTSPEIFHLCSSVSFTPAFFQFTQQRRRQDPYHQRLEYKGPAPQSHPVGAKAHRADDCLVEPIAVFRLYRF